MQADPAAAPTPERGGVKVSVNDSMSKADADTSATRQDASPQAAVEVLGVTKSFGGQPVLRGIDLELRPGAVCGLVGENGSGKSTLIKVLSGFHRPTSGEVRVDGEPLRLGSPAGSHAAGLRFVHQHLGLVPQMNAVENMGLGIGYANRRWVRWKAEAETSRALLADLRIDMDVEKPLSEARAVERTAVAIARALRSDAEATLRLLVLDEPTAALPPAEVDVLFEVVRQASRRGLAVLYVSHRLDEVEEITDEVAVLRDGVLVGQQRFADIGRDGVIAMMIGGQHEVPARERGDVRPRRAAVSDGRGPVLDVRGLRSSTLVDVAFSVGRGEVLGVAGIDGSGRDELARALVGAIPAEGDVRVDGALLTQLTPAAATKAGLALVPSVTEAGSAVAAFTVQENLSLAMLPRLSRRGVLFRRREAATVREWIDRVDVRPADPASPFALLSGGNKQKVVFAKWLALDHPVYVLNEPTAGVDVGARRRLHEFVLEQAAAGTAFVLCSTDLEELEATCRRVLILREGRVAAELQDADVRRETLLRTLSHDGPPPAGLVASALTNGTS